MGIFSKLSERLRKKREESESSADWKEMPSGFKFYPQHPVREGAKRITIDVLQNGDSVDIRMHGLEDVNVCLASFLTKGVSYAQEKYNEYQANKDTDAIVEEPKAEPKIKSGSVKEWQDRVKARERERITREQAKKGGNA
jgi:hypothetical protein